MKTSTIVKSDHIKECCEISKRFLSNDERQIFEARLANSMEDLDAFTERTGIPPLDLKAAQIKALRRMTNLGVNWFNQK